jgi:hypothetical protein
MPVARLKPIAKKSTSPVEIRSGALRQSVYYRGSGAQRARNGRGARTHQQISGQLTASASRNASNRRLGDGRPVEQHITEAGGKRSRMVLYQDGVNSVELTSRRGFPRSPRWHRRPNNNRRWRGTAYQDPDTSRLGWACASERRRRSRAARPQATGHALHTMRQGRGHPRNFTGGSEDGQRSWAGANRQRAARA